MRSINIYTFNELSDLAKNKAIEQERLNIERTGDFAWPDDWVKSIKEGLKYFDAKLVDYAFDYLTEKASWWYFERHGYPKRYISGMELKNWLLTNHAALFAPETSCPFTGYTGDKDFLDVFREFIKAPTNKNLDDLLDDAVKNTVKGMVADCNYQLTNEYISEKLSNRHNEYFEDGSLFKL